MRYVVLVAITLFAAVLTGGVSPQMPIIGAEPDFLLVIMLCLQLRERTVTPVMVCAVAAIFLDAFYGTAIGYYSLPYAAVGLAVYGVFRHNEISAFYIPAGVCALAWVMKDVFTALITFLQGNTFDFFYIFVRTTLPGMLVNGLLALAVYPLTSLIYRRAFMSPRTSVTFKDEFPELKGLQKRGGRFR